MERKYLIILAVCSIVLILASTYVSFVSKKMQLVAHVATVIMVLIQVFALVVIKRQLKLQEHINVANYTLQAMKELREHVELFEKIKDSEDANLSNAEIMSVLNVYENMSSLIDKGAIEFKDIDGPFAYRFFKVCNHPKIQTLELIPDAKYYTAIYRLHRKWLEYRKDIGESTEEERSLINIENYKKLAA